MKNRIIIAIDPGQAAGGVAVHTEASLVTSIQVNDPWSYLESEHGPVSKLDAMAIHVSKCIQELGGGVVRVVYERPANGTHLQREGVTFGAGMYIQALKGVIPIHRGHVSRVTPNQWRAKVLPVVGWTGKHKPRTREDWKKWAIQTAKKTYEHPNPGEDEAEAILIGLYGVLT